MSPPHEPRLLTLDDDGRIALPEDVRVRLGLGHGDRVSVLETPDGVLLTTEAWIAAQDRERVDRDLAGQGLSLDELIESGREIRGDLYEETYGRRG